MKKTVLADFGRRISMVDPYGVELIQQLDQLIAAVDRRGVQSAVQDMTATLIRARGVPISAEQIILVPVMRGALPMWQCLNDFLMAPRSDFVWPGRSKGGNRAAPRLGPIEADPSGQYLVLDTVIATGTTMKQVLIQLIDLGVEPQQIEVFTCYAAPQALDALGSLGRDFAITVGCLADSVDDAGMLVPYTNGDLGDKLYG